MNNHGAILWKIESMIRGKTNVKNPPSKLLEGVTNDFASVARLLVYVGNAIFVSPSASSNASIKTLTSSHAELTPSPKYGFTVWMVSPMRAACPRMLRDLSLTF